MKTQSLLVFLTLLAYSRSDSFVSEADSVLEELFICLNGSNEENQAFSCRNRCMMKPVPYYRHCKCDDECLSHGDCCLDYESECLAPSSELQKVKVVSSISLPDINDRSYLSSDDPDNGTENFAAPDITAGETLLPPDVIAENYPKFDLSLRRSARYFSARGCTNIGNYRYFNFVEKCVEPAFFGSQLEQQCLTTPQWDFLSSLPVAVANDTHYRNIYCAFCNGVQYKDVYFWNVALTCERRIGSVLFGQVESPHEVGLFLRLCSSEIWPTLAPGDNFPRVCLPKEFTDDVYNESEASCQAIDQALCDTYSFPVTVNGSWFKNIHCAFCHGDESYNKSTNISCSSYNYLGFTSMRPISLPTIFTFSARDGASVTYRNHKAPLHSLNSSKCNDKEWFDPFLGECREVYCPSNSMIVDGNCVKDINASSHNFGQCSGNSSFWMQNTRKSTHGPDKTPLPTSWIKVTAISNHQFTVNLIIVTFRVTLTNENLDVEIKDQRRVSSSSINSTWETYRVIFELHILDNSSHITNIPSAIRRAVRLLAYDREITITVLSVEWQNYESLSTYIDICTEALGDISYHVRWAKDTTHYTDDEYNELLREESMMEHTNPKKLTIFTGRDSKEWSKLNLQCCSSPLSCRQIAFNSSEFDWKSVTNGTIVHKASGIIVAERMFSVVDDSRVRVCEAAFDLDTNDNQTPVPDSQTYVTIVGSAVSITSLLVALITIFTFPELQNLPGKIISCLSISLLLANAFLLISHRSSSKYLCLFFGVSLHYTWLSVFFWANALAIDLTRTFRLNSKRRVFQIKGNVQFIFYSIYAWLSPAIIVTIGILVHFLTEHGIYDTVGTCWLIAGQPILTLFLTPFTFLVIVNTTLFIVVVCSISKTKGDIDSKTATRVQSRAIFWLAIRLSATLGVTWSLGFVTAVAHNEVLWYIFNAINSLSGLGVSLSIVVNRRVFRLWQAKFKCNGNSDVEGAKEKNEPNREIAASESRKSSTVKNINEPQEDGEIHNKP